MTGPAVTGLPMKVEDITSEWLGRALARDVSAVEIRTVLHGTATKVLVSAGTDDGPLDLCVKGGFDEAIRPLAAQGYLTEARFFSEVAPSLGCPLPRCWYSGADESAGQGIVVLDDLGAAGARFGRPTEPWHPDLVARALELLARLHAGAWGGRGLDRLSWLRAGPEMIRHNITAILSEESWAYHLAKPKGKLVPEPLLDRARVLRGIERMWVHDDRDDAARTLTHGDAHLGNTYVDADGTPGFLDWQSAAIGPWSSDVGYFLGGALSVDDRRTHDQDLIRLYLAALAAGGGPHLGFDEAWMAVRRRHLHGLCWLLIPEQMQPEDYSAAMAERYATAAIDHDTLGLLESG
jgi:hypothetical protein